MGTLHRIYPSFDGFVQSVGDTFAHTLTGVSSSLSVGLTDTSAPVATAYANGGTNIVRRGFFTFDPATASPALPADYIVEKADFWLFNAGTVNAGIALVQGNPASPSTLTTDDLNSHGSVRLAPDITTPVVNTYNGFGLTEAGRALFAGGAGVAKLCVRTTYDMAGTAPGDTVVRYFDARYSEYGTAVARPHIDLIVRTPAQAPTPPDPYDIICIGDSTTDGTVLGAGNYAQNWPYKLLARLDTLVTADRFTGSSTEPTWNANGDPNRFIGSRYAVWNAGASGERTTAMLARFAADVTNQKPRHVVIFAGFNDIGASVSLAGVVEPNFTSMVNAAKAIGARVTLLTLPWGNGTSDQYAVLSTWLHTYAAANACSLVELYGAGVTLADGTHPNAAGCTAIANAFDLSVFSTLTAAPLLSTGII